MPEVDNDLAPYMTERPFGRQPNPRSASPALGRRIPSLGPVSLAMPVVWSDRHRLHDPGGEVWVGVRIPGTEVPARAERIHDALTEAGARFVDAAAHPDDAVLAIHDP